MYTKILFWLILMKIFNSYMVEARPHGMIIDAQNFQSGGKGKYGAMMIPINATHSYVEFLKEHDRTWITLILCGFESALNWGIGLLKTKSNKISIYYYSVLIIVVTQFSSAYLSYLAMNGQKDFKTLIFYMIGVVVVCNFIYFLVSIFTKHENVFKKNYKFGLTILAGSVLFPIAKIFLYFFFPKKDTFGDAFKLLGLALLPIGTLLIPLIISIYCDLILKYIPECFHKKFAHIILSTGGYKKLKFEYEECVSVTESNGFTIDCPEFEMFGNITTTSCIIYFMKEKTKWVFTCAKPECEFSTGIFPLLKHILFIKNVSHLCDKNKIDIQLTFKNEDSAIKCKKFFAKIFDGDIPTEPLFSLC